MVKRNNGMFWKNLERRITAIAIQLGHADAPGVGTVAKSSYYRAATILLCTAVEGMVYQLVKKHTNPHNRIEKIKDLKELHKVPRSVFGTVGDVYLCERVYRDLCIDDNGVTFGKLNNFLKNRGIISDAEYKMLNLVRKERNKIHLQGLSVSDTGYTKSRFNEISKPLDFLTNKLP